MNPKCKKSKPGSAFSSIALLDGPHEVDAATVMKARADFRNMCISTLTEDKQNDSAKLFAWVCHLPFGHGIVRLQKGIPEDQTIGGPISEANLAGLLIKDGAVAEPGVNNRLLKYVAFPFSYIARIIHKGVTCVSNDPSSATAVGEAATRKENSQ